MSKEFEKEAFTRAVAPVLLSALIPVTTQNSDARLGRGEGAENGAEKPRRDGVCRREDQQEANEEREAGVSRQVEGVESQVQHLGAGGEHPRPEAHPNI